MAIFTAIGSAVATGLLGAAAAGTTGFTFMHSSTRKALRR